MKKLLSFLVIIAALSFVACKNEKTSDKTETDTPAKVETLEPSAAKTAAVVAHTCGADCKDGKHMYAHNEIGHTCTEACGTAHVCGADCKDGNHVYAHGEVGHTCTEACAKM